MSTPFMGLDLPSPLVTPGPTWASLLNTALDAIDAHDHTAGQGVPITPAAMNINADLDLQSHGLQTAKLVNLATNAAALATPSILHSVNGDLVWINANGTAVPITSGNSVVGSPGSIQNLVSPASAQYSSSDSAFRWFSGSGVMAGLDVGFAIFRQGYGSTAPALSVRAPATGLSTWTWSLPAAAGAGIGGMLVVGPSGSSEYWYPDNSTLESVAGVLRAKDLGITTAKLADLSVSTAKLQSQSVTASKILGGTITNAEIASNTILGSNIANSTITGAKIANYTINTINIAANAITSGLILDGAVGDTKILDGSVTSGKIYPAAVGTSKIADLAVTAAKIANATIIGTKIADGGIYESNLAANIVSTAKIAAGAVTPAKSASSFVYAYNAFTADNAGLGGREATPWIIATTPSLLLYSQKLFTITVQPSSGGQTAPMAVRALYSGDDWINVHLRVKLIETSSGNVVRTYNYLSQCNNNIYISVSGLFPGGTVTAYGLGRNTNLIVPEAISDYPVNQTSCYARLEIYSDPLYVGDTIDRVALYMNNWVLTLSQ